MSKAIDEISGVIQDLGFIENEVKKFPYLVRRYNTKVKKILYKELYDSYEHLIIENQLEADNCALEMTYKFIKHGKRWKDYFNIER